ncbi:helix-turn-helix domain-containing protein [Pseudoduganella sp. RAF53_2]|uniref:helix-turn-helix domain-containing protein n=1 Tax=unclassified Pseudoduganella TaxID=2637179 RepID=UPI003F9773CE
MPDDRNLPCGAPSPTEARSETIRIRTGRGEPSCEREDALASHTIAVPTTESSFVLSHRDEAGKLQRVALGERHVAVIPAGICHSFHGTAQAALTTVMIAADFLCTLAEQHRMNEFMLAGHYATVDPFLLYFARTLELRLQRHGPPDRAYLEAAAVVLGQHLLLNYSTTPDTPSCGLPRYKLRRALEYIEQHFHDDIGFQDIAGHVGISPFHFARLFKQATGESPHQRIMRCRIDAAKRMLLESDKPISDIAFEVGYKSQSYFTTRFALLAGMPPAAYRARS